MRDMAAQTAEPEPANGLHRFTWNTDDGDGVLHSELAKVRGWR